MFPRLCRDFADRYLISVMFVCKVHLDVNALTGSLLEIYKPIVEDLKNVDRRLQTIVSEALDPFPRDIGAFRSLGKRMRPALTLLTYRMLADGAASPQAVVEQASAVELMHIATLIHDDVVDGAYQRRGHQTLHQMFTDKTAVLVGDYLYATAIDTFNRFGTRHVVDVVTKTTVGMAHGELMQVLMSPETRSRREVYFKIISKKTADFFAAAVEVGAEAAEVPAERRAALRQAGWNFGMAFQMIDDVLDYTASEDNIGKPVFQDLADGKVTLPAILLLEAGASSELNEILAERRITPAQRDRLLDLLSQYEIIPRCIREADQHLSEARDIVGGVREIATPVPHASFLSLCDYVIQQKGLPQPSLT